MGKIPREMWHAMNQAYSPVEYKQPGQESAVTSLVRKGYVKDYWSPKPLDADLELDSKRWQMDMIDYFIEKDVDHLGKRLFDIPDEYGLSDTEYKIFWWTPRTQEFTHDRLRQHLEETSDGTGETYMLLGLIGQSAKQEN